MNFPIFPYHIFPLGDSAITIDFGNCIDADINREVIARFNQLKEQPFPGMIEAVPAYSSLTIHYDMPALKKKATNGHTIFEWVQQQLLERLQEPIEHKTLPERLVKIPVCYAHEFALDIRQLAAEKKISTEEVIRLHTAKNYKVYMLGFLPGFSYMGEVDERIAMARKPQPINIVSGSVGIAGRQTGIYPLSSPGGWQIIGRTPLRLFDVQNPQPSLLVAGDTVQFYSITKNDFEELYSKL
ncbi:MAG: 5-oxoprolinase subunit PxpB [Bacteroidota bacterium]